MGLLTYNPELFELALLLLPWLPKLLEDPEVWLVPFPWSPELLEDPEGWLVPLPSGLVDKIMPPSGVKKKPMFA